MPKFDIYSRKSIFSGRGDSIENQIVLCKEYIASHFPNSSESDIMIFEDEGFSGKNMERPRFQQMLSHIRQGAVDYVVCYRLDRVSRNVKDFSNLVELLQEYHTDFICIKEEFDTGTPMGRAMMYIASIFSQLERETIGERVKDNFYLLARTGRWLGGPRPTGFIPTEDTILEEGKEKTAFRLTPIAEELEIVKQVFALFLQTASLNGTVLTLVQSGTLTRDQKRFTISSLKSLLRNPVYAKASSEVYQYFLQRNSDLAFDLKDCDNISGLMTYNRSTIGKKGKELRDYADWIVSIGKQEGIINGEDWVRTQEILDGKAMQFAGKSEQKHTALLVGMIRCKHCGASMRVQMDGKPKKDGMRPMRYVCPNKKPANGSTCETPNVDAYAIDSLVWKELLNYPCKDSRVRLGIESLQSSIKTEQATFGNLSHDLERQLIATTKMIATLVMVLAEGNVEPLLLSEIKGRIVTLQKRRAELEDDFQKERNKLQELESSNFHLDWITDTLKWFSEFPDAATTQDKRALIRTLVERVVWDGANAHIFIFGDRKG